MATKAKSKADAETKISQSDEMASLLIFLVPVPENAREKDDVIRPTFANLLEAFRARQKLQMDLCELKDEGVLQEQHTEEWQADCVISTPSASSWPALLQCTCRLNCGVENTLFPSDWKVCLPVTGSNWQTHFPVSCR